MNRRRALTALAVGVVAPGALAACFGRSDDQSEAAAPPTPALTYEPANAAADVLPTAPVGVEVRDGWFQRVTLTNPDGKAVAGAINRDRTAFNATEPLGYGVRLHLGRLGGGPRRQGRPGRRQLHHDQPGRSGQRPVPARRRSGRRRRGADHPAVRRVDQRQGRRGEGAEGHHRSAGRGQLGLAARRGRRFAGALAHPRVLPGRHQGSASTPSSTGCRSATAPTARGTPRWTSRSAAARWSRPKRRRTASR